MNTPAKPVIKKRSYWFEIFLGALILAFLVLTFFAKSNPYFPFDLIITRKIQLINNSLFADLMVFMTSLGYVTEGSILLVIGSLGLYLLKKPHDSAILIISTTGAVVISLIFKDLVSRPRPDPLLINQLATYKVPDSFPSGHVLFFIGFIGYLLYLAHIYIPKSWKKILLELCLVLLLILMGLSRIFLGAHWFSDTLGAYLVGSVWLLGVITLRRRYIDFPRTNS
jgi:undecaprenyl-diphosphatase